MSSTITQWLDNLGLGKYQQVFLDNDIDLDVLAHLTDEDLKELGVSLGHRRKLIAEIESRSASNSKPEQYDISSTPAAPVQQRSEAERRQLTVMFVDMVGSTALSEQLDPEELLELIRSYQYSVVEEITRYEGHIARFMGDGVLAYFGWPRAHEDEAERAVRAGLAAVEAVARLRTPMGEPLEARIGIATGVVVVGDLIGEGAAQEESVVGETPNLAARLQSLAEPGCVVIGPSTRRLVGGLFELEDLGSQFIKGFTDPVDIWQVIGFSSAESRFEAMHETELTPLVGRKHELGLLIDRWQLAKEGEGRVVLLSGEPGIGKSRLTQALQEEVSTVPHLRMRYFCSLYHTNSALHPVIRQLRHASDILVDDSNDIKLKKLEVLIRQTSDRSDEAVPLLADLLSIPVDDHYPALNLSPQAMKMKTFEVLLAQLEDVVARRPALIILEDVHWIDPSTSELFGHVIDRIKNLPALLIITMRPEFNPPWLNHAHVTSLTLSRLGQRQGASIVKRLTGGKALPPEVLDRILSETDGVPLFVEELTQTVLELGLLTDAGDHYELSGTLPSFDIPVTLRDSLMARLDHLAPIKEIAQIGAVIGREFSHQLIAVLADKSEQELVSALEQLIEAELIFRRGLPPEAVYTFKHALIQDAAYESLLKSRRQQLHSQIAEALESTFAKIGASAQELIAQNFTLAGDVARAVPYWHRAGLQALAHSANIEAVSHIKTGLDLLQKSSEHEDLEAQLQLALGAAYAATKGHGSPETAAAFARAESLARTTNQADLIYPALDGQIISHFSRSELEPALILADEFLSTAEQNQDVAPTIPAHANYATIHLSAGKLDLAESHFKQTLALFDEQAHDELRLTFGYDFRVIALGYLAWTRLALGYPDQAIVQAKTSIAIANDVSHPLSLGFALARKLTVLQLRRDVVAVETLVDELHELASEQSFTTYINMAAFYRGWVMVQRGETQEGIQVLVDSMAALRDSKDEDFYPHTLAVKAEAFSAAGDNDTALRLVNEGLERIQRNQEGWFEAELYRLRGRLIEKNSSSEANPEADFLKAIEISRNQGARLWELRASHDLARFWQSHGRADDARDLLSPIYNWFTEGFDSADLQDAKLLLETLT